MPLIPAPSRTHAARLSSPSGGSGRATRRLQSVAAILAELDGQLLPSR
jgi:hypothetical protein